MDNFIKYLSYLFLTVPLYIACSEPVAIQQDLELFDKTPTGFTGKFDYAANKIILRWDQLSNVDFYKLQRYTDTLSDGKPGAVTESIVGSTTSANDGVIVYSDVPSLEKSDHFYILVPCKRHLDDTVFGKPSLPLRVPAGIGISFYINDRSTTTQKRNVALHVEDPQGMLKKISFSQVVNDSALPIFDFSADQDAQNFDQRQISFENQGVGKTRAVSWVLPLGSKEKKVFALLEFYSRDAVSFQPETLVAQLAVAPYYIKTKYEHVMQIINGDNSDQLSPNYRSGNSNATAINEVYQSTKKNKVTINSKFIEFSVSIGSDSTMSQAFDCWIVYGENLNCAAGGRLNAPLWATAPQRFSLTGAGKYHDERQKYVYSFDPNSEQGKINLRYAVPINASLAATYPYVESPLDTSTHRDINQNFKNIISSKQVSESLGEMKKKFILVLKFVGTEFEDDRYYFSEPSLLPGSKLTNTTTESYLDFFVPFIRLIQSKSPYFLTNGDTLVNNLDFVLDEGQSIHDGGLARITKLELIIAKKPANLEWNPLSWKDSSDVPIVNLELFKQNSYSIIPYPIAAPLATLKNVAWNAIDLSAIPSGKYFIGIIASDEFGNEGFAGYKFNQDTKATNPFEVTVLSGK